MIEMFISFITSVQNSIMVKMKRTTIIYIYIYIYFFFITEIIENFNIMLFIHLLI